jgi:pilus assembly protein CpaC
MAGDVEEEAGTGASGEEDVVELGLEDIHDPGAAEAWADPAKPNTAMISERLQLARDGAGAAFESAGAFFGRQPRALMGAACVLTVLGVVFSASLTASLRATLPERVAGIVGSDGNRGNDALQIQMGGGGSADPTQQVAGFRDETNGKDSYLPQSKLDDLGTASTIITVPVSQGRLLRFDDTIGSVLLADPTIADVRVVSSDLVYIYGKKSGMTNLIALSKTGGNADGSGGREEISGSALVRVVYDPRPANEASRQLNESTPVDINIFGKRTAISGHLRNIDQAVDAANVAQSYSPQNQPPINKATIAGSNQINIRVRFAEVQRNDLKSFGINWNVGQTGGFGVTKKTALPASADDANLRFGGKIGSFELDVLIEALQANGSLTILAEPNLTAVTGETASFLAGGEVPIPVPTGNGGDSITVQYKQFGVALSFTPTIVKDNRIAMRVKPEVSSIASNQNFSVQGFNLPSFTVRRAETTVEMASGQTFAMAGLFQREQSRDVDKIPVLGDVPVLGPLFRSERYRRNETELVILITPYLVNPVSDESLATPLDREGQSPWQASIVDPTAKGSGYAEPIQPSGFVLK